MVGSLVFVRYDQVNARLARWLMSPSARRRRRERERRLGDVRLGD
jgi:hypothetical protein